MVRTTGGKGTGPIEWRRPQGARKVAETRWFHEADGPEDATETAERPSFMELLLPLVALSLGAVFAIAIAAVAIFAVLSLLI